MDSSPASYSSGGLTVVSYLIQHSVISPVLDEETEAHRGQVSLTQDHTACNWQCLCLSPLCYTLTTLQGDEQKHSLGAQRERRLRGLGVRERGFPRGRGT